MMLRNAIFAYPVTKPYSGQTAATLLAVQELEALGWTCHTIGFRGMDCSGPRLLNYLRFALSSFFAWGCLGWQVVRNQSVICFNHPQTLTSFLRMGLPHLLLRYILPRRHFVSSLHGNVFMTWERSSLKMRLFLRILEASDAITVLGENQRGRLIDLGIPPEKLVVLPNTGDAEPQSTEVITAKQASLTNDPKAPLVLLHLSLLIETKGFPEFLEACLLLASQGFERPLKVVLCGPIVFTSDCTRFATADAKIAWIEGKIAELNLLPNVTATWLPGAIGEEKSRLFNEAHCFVMPSRYPVEAQPLVLLEAMAAGCCLIASDQGEIPSTMGGETGLCLQDVSPRALARAIEQVATDHSLRLKSALASRDLSVGRFSRASYARKWDKLLRAHSDS